jgi:tRNA/tmRNA/rRNA uracil-C5-methylase (TrmA/RlmC/RlmD family)
VARASGQPDAPAPGSTVPGSTVPGSTVPGSTVPGSTVPGSTVPGSTGEGESGDGAGPGKVVFVRHALPGERVRARVTSGTARFARADAIEVLDASPGRVEPPCRYAHPGGCGGCDLQHASPAAQRAIKAQVISEQLRRIAGIDRDVEVAALPEPAGLAGPGSADTGTGGADTGAAGTGSAGTGGAGTTSVDTGGAGTGGADTPGAGLGWRTRVGFAVRPDGTAGLRRHRSREVVAVDDCLIAHPLVREADVPGSRWPGARGVEVTVSPGSGERSVLVTGRGRAGPRRGGQQRAGQQKAGQPGPRPLTQHAAGRAWRVSPGVFWQVHPAAADVLTGAVLAALRPEPGDVALDLYCGAGLFAGALAAAVGAGGKVTAIESQAAAVRDARKNLAGFPQVRVHRGDAAEVLGRHGPGGAGLAVLDPPRAGATAGLIELLAGPASGLRRVAYVSCDPATLARDIALFAGLGWQLADLRGFDAFPMTHHVECLATLIPG